MNPGDVYAFDLPTDVPAFWLVVREHPDGGPFLLVPCDDTPLQGACDVPLPALFGPGQAVQVARCGLSAWCDLADLTRRRPAFVTRADPISLSAVRERLAGLARGVTPPASATDDDPEYLALCGELEQLGLHLSGGRIG